MTLQDLIARLKCKVCKGTRNGHHSIDGYGGLKAYTPCPQCTNLDDEEAIIEIVQYLAGWYDNPGYDDGLAELCAKRGIDPDKGGAELHEVPSVKDAINLATTNLSLVPKREWAWLMFSILQSLADQEGLDLAGAVDEVMRDRA